MFGPKIYQQQLDELEIDGMEIDVSNIQKAMETMNELEELENVLKKLDITSEPIFEVLEKSIYKF